MTNLILRAIATVVILAFAGPSHAKQHDEMTERATTDAVLCPQITFPIDVRPGESVVESLLQLPEAEYLKNCVFTLDEKGRVQILGSKKEFRKKESKIIKPNLNGGGGGDGNDR